MMTRAVVVEHVCVHRSGASSCSSFSIAFRAVQGFYGFEGLAKGWGFLHSTGWRSSDAVGSALLGFRLCAISEPTKCDFCAPEPRHLEPCRCSGPNTLTP